MMIWSVKLSKKSQNNRTGKYPCRLNQNNARKSKIDFFSQSIPKSRQLSTQNIQCVIFVKINNKFRQIDPVLIVNKIMEDVYVRNKDITRYCHKILPVERAFKAEHFKMLDVVDQLFNQKTQPGQIKSWSLNFKLRNNSKFNYKEVLRECDKIAGKYGHFADIYYPQWTLSIEIANHLMCICLSDKFKEYNQYKLHKKVPKQQRPKREQKQKRQDVNQQKFQPQQQQNRLKTETQLRQMIEKAKEQHNIKSERQRLEPSGQVEQKRGAFRVQQADQKDEPNQIKQLVGNKKLLQQKIAANVEDDDVDLF